MTVPMIHAIPVAQAIDIQARKALRRSGYDDADTPAAAQPDAVMRQLDTCCGSAVAQMLANAGDWRQGGRPLHAHDVASALHAAPRHAWLVRRWLDALCSLGWLERGQDAHQCAYRWHAQPRQPIPPPPACAPCLSHAYAALRFPPDMAPVHERALASLHALVTDRMDIKQILFQNGSVLDALGAYQDNIFTTYLNQSAAHLLRQACETFPEPPRVLELGAGCGLTTAAMAGALEGRVASYLCTDISPLFTNALRARLRHPGWRCAEVDIHRDFTLQGLAPASIDIVLATNVLHNAFHTQRSLRHIHRVLRRGGWLVFTESTEEHLAVQTCMQFLLSAPAGQPRVHPDDPRSRDDRAFLDVRTWFAELAASGFQPRFTLPADGHPLAAADQRLFFAIAQ